MSGLGGEDAAPEDAESGWPAIPGAVAGTFDISIGALGYNGGQLRDAKLTATLDDGALTISELSAAGPGDSKLRLVGRVTTPESKPEFKGRLFASATNLRGVADLLEISMDRRSGPTG